MEEKDHLDKRTLKRRHLVFYLEIYDSETNELIGNLGDITTQGILVLSPTPEFKKPIFKIKIKLPNNERYNQEFLELNIESKWSQVDINPNHFAIGCQIIDSNPKDINIIKDLINELAFNN